MKLSRSGLTINSGSKLAGFCLIAAIIGFLLLTYTTESKVSIGSQSYTDIVAGKDFVADFLPPALYPVETFADAHIIDGDLQTYTEVLPRILANREAYDTRLKHWQETFANSNVLEKSEWTEINKQLSELGERFWVEVEGKFLPAAQTRNQVEASASVDRLALMMGDYRSLLAKVSKDVGTRVASAETAGIEMASNSNMLLMSIGIGMVAFVLLIVYFAQKIVVNSLTQLSSSMRKLASGNLDTEVPYTNRTDEVGQMAQSLDVFKAMAVKERENKEDLENVIQVVGSSLGALANGDLTHRIADPFPEAIDRLRISFNDAATQLSSVIANVKNGADGMKSGTEEIAQASDDLSRRTETQAANLEETAAAVAEIVATVKKTANGAGHARKVVSMAKDEADRSGEVVRKAVDAMQGIEKSSIKINQIIGVIDEIAFQTSLLALNAGVEAARAGDAGRGFAVVAAEVRALAQRSAEAAKEIKDLLSSSRVQVEQGVQLVGDTGTSLKNIIERVAEINAVVAEIAAGAEQQSSSLQEVNTAVDQMDQVTQQNAAMVEQATAATRTLTQQSAELAQIVAKFNTVASMVAQQSARPSVSKHISAPRVPSKPRRLEATGTDNSSGWEEF